MKKKSLARASIIIFLVFFTVLGIIVTYFNSQINEQVDTVQKESNKILVKKEVKEDKSKVLVVKRKKITPTYSVAKKSKKLSVVRKTDRDPEEHNYIRHRFIKNGKLVASYKEHKNEIIELTGQIPNGEIGFVNHITNTVGIINYADQEVHGHYKEYDAFRNLLKEGRYSRGKLVSLKEYYDDGQIKLKQNYYTTLADAEVFKFLPVGSGASYYPNGILKEKWDFSFNDSVHGIFEHFDQAGNIILSEKYDKLGSKVTH